MPPPPSKNAGSFASLPAWAAGLALWVLPWLVYWPSLHAPWVFDDAGAVVNNATIRSWSTALLPPADGSTTTGRPLLNLSFALNYALAGDNVAGWHAGNLLLHGGATWLAWLALRRMLAGLPRGRTLAWGIAVLWCIHPLNTESVVCIAQRSELLCTVLYLGAVAAFLALLDSEGRRATALGAVSVGCAWLGMAAKEVTVTLPLVMLLLDRAWGAGSFAEAWRRRKGYYVALASSWLLLGAILWAGGGTRGVSAGAGLGIGVWEYLLCQCEALVRYAALAVWPFPLVIDYGFGVPAHWTEVWWQGAVVLGALAAATWALVRRPKAGMVGAWWFIILAPSSSFIPLVAQTIAEHRVYLPLLGLLAGGVMAVSHWVSSVRVGVALATVVVAFAGWRTMDRQQDYLSPERLWAQTVQDYPASARAHLNLGLEQFRAGHFSAARESYANALARAPGYALAHYNVGLAWQAEGRWLEAQRAYEAAVALAPNNADMRVNHAAALAELGLVSAAISELERAAALQPAFDVHYNLGLLLQRTGAWRDADAAFQKAFGVRDAADLRATAGLGFARGGQWAAAERHLLRAVELAAGDADAWANLGNVRLMQERFSDAIAAYQQALLLRPQDAAVQRNLQVAREAKARASAVK